jgi:hypothetical protein
MRALAFALGLLTASASFGAQLVDGRIRRFSLAADFTSSTSYAEGTIAYALDTDTFYHYTEAVWVPLPKSFATNALLQASSEPEGVIAYAVDTNTSYLRSGSSWRPLDPRSIEWSMTFNEGASKGFVAAAEAAGAAYSTTPDALNYITYGYPPIRFTFVTNTTATGTVTPAAEALGIDLNAGSPGDNDEWTATFGTIDGTGGPAIIGTTPAFKFCATLSIHDVDGTDGLYVMVTSTGLHVDLSSADPNYTSYCAIGITGSSDPATIFVSDNTTGGTDTTNTWANDASKEVCILVGGSRLWCHG